MIRLLELGCLSLKKLSVWIGRAVKVYSVKAAGESRFGLEISTK